MTKLPKLYSKDEKGKVREWQVVVDGDHYWTVAGCVGGKMVTSKPKLAKAKNLGRSNATTAEEQALRQAKRQWDVRVENGSVQDIESASQGKKLEFFKPMLANTYNPKKPDFPYYSQPKLDGIRCLLRLEDGELVARTRNGKIIDCVEHIKVDLASVFDKYPNLVLDGELYNHELKENFNKITSLVRKKRPTDPKKLQEFQEVALRESEDLIEYWVYDMHCPKNKKFSERYEFLDRCLSGFFPSIVLVETYLLETSEKVDEVYSLYMDSGYEGQMLRKDQPYETRRSKSLLKRKDFQDNEYLVVDVMEGVGNRKGTAGNLVVKCLDTGKTFHSNIKANFTRLTEILNNKDDFVGKLVTIQYFNLTPDGIPRFPFAIEFRDYE